MIVLLGLAYSTSQLQEQRANSILGVKQDWILILHMRIIDANRVNLSSHLNSLGLKILMCKMPTYQD